MYMHATGQGLFIPAVILVVACIEYMWDCIQCSFKLSTSFSSVLALKGTRRVIWCLVYK